MSIQILPNLTPRYLRELIPEQVQHIANYAFRIRTALMANSFVPSSTIKQWDSRDDAKRNVPTLSSYKST